MASEGDRVVNDLATAEGRIEWSRREAAELVPLIHITSTEKAIDLIASALRMAAAAGAVHGALHVGQIAARSQQPSTGSHGE